MTEYSEVIEERDGWRVKLVPDQDASEPDGDVYAPTLRIGPGHRPEHMKLGSSRPTTYDERVGEAVQLWGDPNSDGWKLVEKYMRAYLGTTKISTWNSGNYWYVAYDTAEWREFVGADPEHLKEENLLHDVKAWADGEAYGVVVEKRKTWHSEEDPDDTLETWEEVNSVWGFYGYDYAVEIAKEILSEEME